MKVNQKSKIIGNNKENKSLPYIKFHAYDKYKDLLQNLLKNTLEPNLITCEKNTANHLSILKTSLELTKITTDIVIKLESQINQKNLKDAKKTPFLKSQKKSIIQTKSQTLRVKTPLKNAKSYKQIPTIENYNKTIANFNKKNLQINNDTSSIVAGKRKTMTRINTISNFNRNSLQGSQCMIYKNTKKLNMPNLNNYKTNNHTNLVDKTFTDISVNEYSLQRGSKISQKSNDSFKNNIANAKKFLYNKRLKTEGNNVDLNISKNKIKNMKNNPRRKSNYQNVHKDDNAPEFSLNISTSNINNGSKRKKTPFRDRRKTAENGNSNSKNISNQKNNLKQKRILTSLELNLQKEDLINYLDNEPLLTNCDITPTEILIRKNTKEIEESLHNLNKLINEKNINFNNILDFLQLEDAINLKNVSKKFRKIFLEFILSKYEKEKIFLNELKTIIENTNNGNPINKNINLENLTLSKSAIYAINLLNEELLNKLFDNKHTPRDDVLLIYKIFFLLIDNPIKDIQYENKNEFWGKCRDYFLKEAKGNIGDLLINIVKNKKICTKEKTLIKIWNLVKNKLDKIKPTHFEKICPTTELISFFICDILDFLGISNDLKYQVNGYFIYLNIINDVNNKINILKKSK